MARKKMQDIPFGFDMEKSMEVFCISDRHAAAEWMHTLARRTKNSVNARKLAAIYENVFEEPFPGGLENAFIERYYLGHWQRSSGYVEWTLQSRSQRWHQDNNAPHPFGSQETVKNCLKNPELIDY